MTMATVERTDGTRSTARVSSEILDRLPPQNLDAEKGVLGSMLLDPRLCDDVALVLRPDDFYADANQKLYGHMLADARRGQADRHDAAGRAAASRRATSRRSAARPIWPRWSSPCPYAANAVYYAEIVRDKATLRALIHASTEILRDAYEPTLEPRELLEPGRGEDLRRPRPSAAPTRWSSIHDVLVEAFDRIDARLEHGGGDRHPHRLHRPRQPDRRPARLGVGHPGRPAQHGQDRPGHEHRRVRGHRGQRARRCS